MNSPEIALSFRKIASAQCIATVLAAVLWTTGSFVGGFGRQIAAAGVAESVLLLPWTKMHTKLQLSP